MKGGCLNPNCATDHVICVEATSTFSRPARFTLVGAAGRSYFWVGPAKGNPGDKGDRYILDEPRTLRSLAYAILRTVKAPKKRARRKR